MKVSRIAIVSAAYFLLATLCPGQNKQWDRRFGGSSFDYARAIRQTSDGGYIIAGYSSSGAGGDKTEGMQGNHDYWVVKTDASGNKQWDRRFGGFGGNFCNDVRQTSDGGYILAGYTDSGAGGDVTQAARGAADYWIVKLNSSGAKQWDRRFGGSGNDSCTAVLQTSDGGYLLAGSSSSGAGGDKTEGSRGPSDYWVVKTDSAGNKQWDRRFGGFGVDALYAAQQTSDGGFILAGESYSGLGGDKSEESRGNSDYWIFKINADGSKQWDARFGGTGGDSCKDIQQTADGGYILAGYSASDADGDKSEFSRGGIDYWIVKVNANGIKQWDKSFGGTQNDFCTSVQQTSDGGYILAGDTISGVGGDKTQESRGLYDYWIVKVNASGSKQWDRRFGGSLNEFCYAIQNTSDGGYIIAGDSWSNADGDKTEISRGAMDFWIVKLSGPTTSVQRWDTSQPITGYTSSRWAFLTAWNLATGGFEASGSWRRGTQQWDHDATGYNQWIARFVYDQSSMQTRALAWYYRQVHVQ